MLPFSWKNLGRNWLLPLSAAAFFCLQITYFRLSNIISILAAVLFAAVIAGKQPSLLGWLRKQKPGFLLYCFLTAVGTSLGCASVFIDRIHTLFRNNDPENAGLIAALNTVAARLSISTDTLIRLSDAAALLAGVLSVCIVLVWTAFLLSHLWRRLRPLDWLKDTPRWELAVYGLLFLAASFFSITAFLKSQAFYGTDYYCDIIYTTDSTTAVSRLWLLSASPIDIRHPFFPFFASPFAGIPYLLSWLFPSRLMWSAILMNEFQIALLIVTNYLLARILQLTPGKRLCFILPLSFTYTYLFSVLAIETYITSYLWLILFLHMVFVQKQQDIVLLLGAGGSISTSLVLTPLMSSHSPLRSFKGWFLDMWKAGIAFLLAMAAFGNVDLLLDLKEHLSVASNFAGGTTAFYDRLLQYLVFIPNCFLPPEHQIVLTETGSTSWFLTVPTTISILGIVLLALMVGGFLMNRKKPFSQLCLFWVFFSFVILCLIGWGTHENGLNLYSLYFCWAMYTLLFQLADAIAQRLRWRYALPVICGIAAIGLLAVNLPALNELIQFAIQYYPA